MRSPDADSSSSLHSVQLICVSVHVSLDPPDERLQRLYQGELGHRNIRVIIFVSCARPLSTTRHQLILCNRDIPLVVSAYLIWKFLKKTKITDLADIPLTDALRQADLENEARYHD